MKKVIYSSHLEFRLKIRKISRSLPKRIYLASEERYFDAETDKYVAVMQAQYQGKLREMGVIYEEDGGAIILITVHPLKYLQKSHRIKSGRWKKI